MTNFEVDITKQATAFGIKICGLDMWLSAAQHPTQNFA
jgi:hypothetical protein